MNKKCSIFVYTCIMLLYSETRCSGVQELIKTYRRNCITQCLTQYNEAKKEWIAINKNITTTEKEVIDIKAKHSQVALLDRQMFTKRQLEEEFDKMSPGEQLGFHATYSHHRNEADAFWNSGRTNFGAIAEDFLKAEDRHYNEGHTYAKNSYTYAYRKMKEERQALQQRYTTLKTMNQNLSVQRKQLEKKTEMMIEENNKKQRDFSAWIATLQAQALAQTSQSEVAQSTQRLC